MLTLFLYVWGECYSTLSHYLHASEDYDDAVARSRARFGILIAHPGGIVELYLVSLLRIESHRLQFKRILCLDAIEAVTNL